MSGHSKWSSIKHKKAANDSKKSQIFGKLASVITFAAKQGGDPEMNYKLRMAIDKAKAVNMPINNIEKAINRGASTGEENNLEELLIEGYGPGGKAILIKAITDNRNRTIAEIRHILSKYNGKMAEGGSVQWLFDEKGEIVLEKEKLSDEDELKIIESGAEDIIKEEEISVLTSPSDLNSVKIKLESANLLTKESRFVFIPKNLEVVSESEQSQYEKIFEVLDDNNDVTDIFYNFIL